MRTGHLIWSCSKRRSDVLARIRDFATVKMSIVTKTIVSTPHIYKPVGPYSQAILVDKTLYVSGTLGMDQTAQLVAGGAGPQARQALTNIKHVLEAGGASLESVIKTTILLNDIADFQTVNAVYGEFFQKDCPARATFQVGKLPAGAAVEIEAIALSGNLVVAEAGPCPCSNPAILVDNTLYVSGTLGVDPQGQLVCGGAEVQARQALTNIKRVLEAGGASLESVVKTTVLLNDISDYQAVNQVYAEFFPKDCPARSMFQAGELPKGAAVEIEMVALSGDLIVADVGPCPCSRR